MNRRCISCSRLALRAALLHRVLLWGVSWEPAYGRTAIVRVLCLDVRIPVLAVSTGCLCSCVLACAEESMLECAYVYGGQGNVGRPVIAWRGFADGGGAPGPNWAARLPVREDQT